MASLGQLTQACSAWARKLQCRHSDPGSGTTPLGVTELRLQPKPGHQHCSLVADMGQLQVFYCHVNIPYDCLMEATNLGLGS